MHAVKGGWVGQTFALARCNESEGKKSRIRRSKEERKSMVESFIKKYQSSHNGNFPSLNLTHKEVGGSFYTVREIIREIIQENRVLGPAKLSPDDLNTTEFDEQFPLGSISKEPQTPLNITSNGSHFMANDHQGTSEELVPLDSIAKEPQSPLNTTSNGSHFVPNHPQSVSEEPVPISDELCNERENQRFHSEPVPISKEPQIPLNITSNGSHFIANDHPGTSEEPVPLDSIAKEPQSPLNTTSNGSHFVPNHHQSVSEEPVPISDELCNEHENHKFHNEATMNGSQVDAKIEESAESTSEDLLTIKPLEAEERLEKLATSTAIVTPLTAEVVVETFPLRPIPKAADCLGVISRVQNMTETLKESEIDKVDKEEGNARAPLDQNSSETSDLLDEKKEESLENVDLGIKSGLVDKEGEVLGSFADPSLNSPNCSATEGGKMLNTTIGKDVEFEVLHKDVLTSEVHGKRQGIDGTKEIHVPDGKIPSGTYSSSSSSSTRMESKTSKAVVVESEADCQPKRSSLKGSNPTLERIPLESWNGASRNSGEKETNPILAVFKSFIAAFIKFWSE